METHEMPARRRSRLRRWVTGLVVLALVLAIYAVALRWFTVRVEADVHKSIRALPVAGEPAQR